MVSKFFRPQTNILSAASVLMAAVFLSRILGLVRDRFLAGAFFDQSTAWQLDVYFAAFRLPDMIFQLLVVGAFSAAFIPVFSQYLIRQKDSAWHIASSVINIGLLFFLGLGAILAIAQRDIKRMFAYSSISQVGYIIFALGIGTPLAILGGLFHLFNHAVFKALLFLNAGAIEYSTGTRDLKRLGGLNSRLPVTGFTSLAGSMSISGIPPLGGFFSKLVIIIAAIQARHFGCALIAILVSVVTLAYYLKFMGFTFFGKSQEGWSRITEPPRAMRLSMIVLAVICAISGLLMMPLFKGFLQSAVDVLLSGTGYAETVFGAIR